MWIIAYDAPRSDPGIKKIIFKWIYFPIKKSFIFFFEASKYLYY